MAVIKMSLLNGIIAGAQALRLIALGEEQVARGMLYATCSDFTSKDIDYLIMRLSQIKGGQVPVSTNDSQGGSLIVRGKRVSESAATIAAKSRRAKKPREPQVAIGPSLTAFGGGY